MKHALPLTSKEKASISRRFKNFRKNLLLTQGDLAGMMGLSLPTYRKLEGEELDAVSVKVLQRIREFEQKQGLVSKSEMEVMRVPR